MLVEDEINENIQETAHPLNEKKILIIEDDNDVREFLKEEIGQHFEVVAESDGISGLERARNYDADLIICDVLMPGMNGFEVTRKLKEDFTTSHIPIILLTALDSPDKQLEGVETGADAYITKPFSPKYLLTRIYKLIEQREKLRERDRDKHCGKRRRILGQLLRSARGRKSKGKHSGRRDRQSRPRQSSQSAQPVRYKAQTKRGKRRFRRGKSVP